MPTSALGQLSYNTIHRRENIIGKSSRSRTLYGHNGITEGPVATTYPIPSPHSAIVVLSNAADAGDASEATAQIMLQALFDLQLSVDLVAAVQLSRNERLERHEKMISTWQENRDVSKYKATPEELVGSYIGLNVSRINIIRSYKSSSGLAVVFADQDNSRCELEPYNSDSLSYLPMKHDEVLARGTLETRLRELCDVSQSNNKSALEELVTALEEIAPPGRTTAMRLATLEEDLSKEVQERAEFFRTRYTPCALLKEQQARDGL
ncbi:hypothetical protein ACSS6W_007533 [Trichoderma asperelloides]